MAIIFFALVQFKNEVSKPAFESILKLDLHCHGSERIWKIQIRA